MATVLLIVHLMIAMGLVGVVLLQRSEGGGLGIGGGSGGFMTGRGTANLLTRTTAALAALFFVTSISLTLVAKQGARQVSPLDLPATSQPAAPGAQPSQPGSAPAKDATPGTGILKSLEGGKAPLPKSQ